MRSIVTSGVLLFGLVVGCSDEPAETTALTTPSTTPASTTPAPVAVQMASGEPMPLPPEVPQLETDERGVPTRFAWNGSEPPEEPTALGIYPVIEGTGQVLQAGDQIAVHYVGQLYPDGAIFDESWSSGQPAVFAVGVDRLIQGWDQGLVGQRVGSRVVLVIPSKLGYGPSGFPPEIPGGASLIFSVDILAIA